MAFGSGLSPKGFDRKGAMSTGHSDGITCTALLLRIKKHGLRRLDSGPV